MWKQVGNMYKSQLISTENAEELWLSFCLKQGFTHDA